MAMCRSRGGRSETSRSPMRTVPPSMRSRPARHLSSVVFPQPEGPSRTMNSPSRTRRSTSLSAVVFPKVLRTDSNATLDMVSSPSRSPEIEQVLAHEEDKEERWDDHEEAAREAEVERRDVQRGQDLGRQRGVADRQDRRREDFIPRSHEAEDRRRREAGKRERQRDPRERAEPRGPERLRRLLELTRDREEHAGGHDHDEGQHHRGVDEDHGDQGVVETQIDERDRERYGQDRDREHLRDEDANLEAIASRESEARERVPGRRADEQAQHDRRERDDDAVPHRRKHSGRVDEEAHGVRREACRKERFRKLVDRTSLAERREGDQIDRDERPERQDHSGPVQEDAIHHDAARHRSSPKSWSGGGHFPSSPSRTLKMRRYVIVAAMVSTRMSVAKAAATLLSR